MQFDHHSTSSLNEHAADGVVEVECRAAVHAELEELLLAHECRIAEHHRSLITRHT